MAKVIHYAERPTTSEYGESALWDGPGWYVLDRYGCHGPYNKEQLSGVIRYLKSSGVEVKGNDNANTHTTD